MSMFWRGLACLACVVVAGSASAVEKWTITDLGSSRTESLCVAAATESFLSFSNVFGASKVIRATWTVYGYGLNNSEHDAVITCTFSTANATRATLVVYSENAVQGGLISNRLAQHFYDHNDRLEQEWLDAAYKRFGF